MKKGGLSFLFVLLTVLVLACGDEKKVPRTPTVDSGMDDALALLPGSAIAVGTVDARTFFSSPTFGAELAKLVEKYLPIGQEAGFQASRDVDRVTFASYAYQGIDAAGIIIGRFDDAKIKQVVAQHTPTRGGGMLVLRFHFLLPGSFPEGPEQEDADTHQGEDSHREFQSLVSDHRLFSFCKRELGN